MITVWKTPIAASVEQILRDLKLMLFAEGLLRDQNNTGSDVMVTCPFHKRGHERNRMRTGLYKGLSNEELVKLYKAGDAEAFDELMKKTEGLRITLAQRYLNIPGSEFEDLMSEGAMEMLSAIQNFDSEKYSSSFSTFLYAAISRHYNDLFTKCLL